MNTNGCVTCDSGSFIFIDATDSNKYKCAEKTIGTDYPNCASLATTQTELQTLTTNTFVRCLTCNNTFNLDLTNTDVLDNEHQCEIDDCDDYSYTTGLCTACASTHLKSGNSLLCALKTDFVGCTTLNEAGDECTTCDTDYFDITSDNTCIAKTDRVGCDTIDLTTSPFNCTACTATTYFDITEDNECIAKADRVGCDTIDNTAGSDNDCTDCTVATHFPVPENVTNTCVALSSRLDCKDIIVTGLECSECTETTYFPTIQSDGTCVLISTFHSNTAANCASINDSKLCLTCESTHFFASGNNTCIDKNDFDTGCEAINAAGDKCT